MTGYKTLIFSAALMLLGVLETADLTNLLALVPDQFDGLVVAAIGVVVAALRFATRTPVGKPE